jgi:hypothetical protein
MRASIQRDIAPRLGINEVPLPGMLNKEMSDLNQLRTRYVAGLEDSDLSRSADLVKYYHPSEQGIESLTRIAPDLGFHGVGKEDFRKMFLPEATDAYLTRADQMWNHLDPEEIAKEARTIDQMLASIAKDERLMKISPQEFIGGITDLAKQHVRGPSYDEMFGINRRAVERAANEAQLRQMREADRLFGTGPVVTPVPTQAQQLPSSARSYLEQILAGTRMPRDYNQNTDSLATILETIQQHMEHPAARGANAESHLSELINRLGL